MVPTISSFPSAENGASRDNRLVAPPAGVSVIIPCFRSERYLRSAIESVQASGHDNWEIIVVDDGSPDDCALIASTLADSDDRIRLIRQPNKGACAARNAGAAASDPASSYLLFLDPDDLIDADMLGTMVAELDAYPEAGMAFCKPRRIDALGRTVAEYAYENHSVARYVRQGRGYRRLTDNEPETPFSSLFAYWCGPLPCVSLYRRSAFFATDGWSVAQGQGGEDWDLAISVAMSRKVRFVPNVMASWRVHPGQASMRINKGRQEDRMYANWLRRTDLDQVQRRMVQAAWRFRTRTLYPQLNWKWAFGAAKGMHVLDATRFFLRGSLTFVSSWTSQWRNDHLVSNRLSYSIDRQCCRTSSFDSTS